MSFNERFIDEIKKRPCLWNSALQEYSDRNLKVKCWEELVEIFKEKNDMTEQERKELCNMLQKKWKSIRGCFTREINRQKLLKSGYGVGRKSEYVYFKLLEFLNNLKSEENTEDEEDDDVELSNESDETNDYYDTETITKQEEEDMLFLLSLVSALHKVPSQKKIATKIKIMSIIDRAIQLPIDE